MEDGLARYQLAQMNRATRSWSGMRECTMVQLITCIYPIFIDYSNSQLFAARVMDKGLSNSMICGWGLTACSAHHKWLGLSCCWSRLMGGQRGTGRGSGWAGAAAPATCTQPNRLWGGSWSCWHYKILSQVCNTLIHDGIHAKFWWQQIK